MSDETNIEINPVTFNIDVERKEDGKLETFTLSRFGLTVLL